MISIECMLCEGSIFWMPTLDGSDSVSKDICESCSSEGIDGCSRESESGGLCGAPKTCSPTPETRSLTCAKCEVAGWRPRATLTQWRGFDDEMLG